MAALVVLASACTPGTSALSTTMTAPDLAEPPPTTTTLALPPAAPPLPGGTAPELFGLPGEPGATWELVAGTRHGQPLPIVADAPVTLVEAGPVYSGRAACNTYAADRNEEGAVVGRIASTLMGCRPDIAESEQAYLDALADVRTRRVIDDRLVLTGDRVRLEFERSA